MKPALKLNVAVAHFPYGGNGATSSEHPDIRRWEVETTLKAKADPRIGSWQTGDYSDTPITMTRNRAVVEAKQAGAHLLLMVDSDQSPDKHRGEAWFKPFWDEAFNFVYERYSRGLITIVGAPYCGPPDGCENVYVFQWATRGNRSPHESIYSLDQYTRNEAAMMAGIQECAALPTGMFLMDLRAADLVEPGKMSRRQIWKAIRDGKMSEDDFNLALKEGYFYYEYTDQFCSQKASTEDVTFTRDVALAGMAKLGYNPIHCAWDSWVGHHKPWNVGKPQRYTTEHINAAYKRAIDNDARQDDRIVQLQMPEWAKQMARENERMSHVNGNGKPKQEPSHEAPAA
jgi:hypothetical protein